MPNKIHFIHNMLHAYRVLKKDGEIMLGGEYIASKKDFKRKIKEIIKGGE